MGFLLFFTFAVAFMDGIGILVKHEPKIDAVGINIHKQVKLIVVFVTGNDLVHKE